MSTGLLISPPIHVTFAERMALTPTILGQWYFQTDDGPAGEPRGYYVWTGQVFVLAETMAGQGDTMIDGRGLHLFAAAGIRIYNLDKYPTGGFLLVANPTGNDALLGVFDGAFVGMEISPTGEVAIATRYGEVLGLWARTTGDALIRLMDLKCDPADGNRVAAYLRYGNGVNFGRVPVCPLVRLDEVSNSGGSETDAFTWQIDANSLLSNNSGMRFRFRGSTAANPNNKRVRISVGGTIVADTGSVAANSLGWEAEVEIFRVDASNMKYHGWANFSNQAPQLLNGTAAMALTANQNIITKLTGVSSLDITQKEFYVETVS